MLPRHDSPVLEIEFSSAGLRFFLRRAGAVPLKAIRVEPSLVMVLVRHLACGNAALNEHFDFAQEPSGASLRYLDGPREFSLFYELVEGRVF